MVGLSRRTGDGGRGSLSINRLDKEGDSKSYSLSTRLIPPYNIYSALSEIASSVVGAISRSRLLYERTPIPDLMVLRKSYYTPRCRELLICRSNLRVATYLNLGSPRGIKRMDNERDRDPTGGNCGRYPIQYSFAGWCSKIGEASLES